MKLKNKLMISYVLIISGIVLLAHFITQKGLRELTTKNTNTARTEVEKFVNKNNKEIREFLTKVGEKLLMDRSEIAEYKLQPLLLKLKQPYNYDQIRKNSEIRKIATAKIFIPKHQTQAGNFDLIDTKGVSVIHPDPSVEGQNYQRWEKQYPKMWNLVQESFTKTAVSGYYTFLDKNHQPIKKFMALNRIEGTPFIICAFVEIKLYFDPIINSVEEQGTKNMLNLEDAMEASVDQTLADTLTHEAIGGIALILIGILLAIWQSNQIANPLQNLCEKVQDVGKGNFAVNLPEKGVSEIAELATSFNALGKELTKYMENLKKETTARQAIESEIAITRRIQESLLPHTFPPFPDKTEFDLHASLVPAKDVSGDFYDFFFVDKETLVLIIADVSGKGLPASLFMAVTRTLLRNLCMNAKDYSPEIILNKANDYLCQENDACMFVTTFLAFYNVKTGKMTYANAGHNEIISWQDNIDFKHFGGFINMPLGIVPQHSFEQAEYNLTKNETLIFYTDGVTEAINHSDEQYGIKRFEQQILKYNSKNPLITITNAITEDLDEYQGDKQFDDITLMMLRRN